MLNEIDFDESFIRRPKNIPTKLNSAQLYAWDPMQIKQHYLIDTEIKLSPVITTINTLEINPDSPKTKKVLEQLKIEYEQLQPKELTDFCIKNELIKFTEKRHQIHLLQVARLRKQVILHRNKLKNEMRSKKKKTIQNLDNTSHSDHLKSPTEMIESWIENHFTKSQKYMEKLTKIKQQKENEEKQGEEQQSKFIQILKSNNEKKRRKRLLTLEERKQRAKELNSRSLEIQRKMKIASNQQLKESQLKQEIERQASINLDKKIDQLKLQFSEQLEQKSQMYQEKQQRAVQIKQEQELGKSVIASLQLLKTERNSENIQQNSSKKMKVDLWSVRLPQLLHKKEENFQQDYNNNLVYVVNKFKRINSHKSVKSAHSREDSSLKLLQQRERYSSKQEYFQQRKEQVEGKLKRKSDYLNNFQQQKQMDLDNKFQRVRNQILENENRHEMIQKQFHDKLNSQMAKEINKHKFNLSLMKQREEAVEGLIKLRQFDKSKSVQSFTKTDK